MGDAMHGSTGFPVARAIVFIVGLPRTGTHLMREILNTSPDVGIGMESHFLGGAPRFGLLGRRGFRAELRAAGDVRTDEGARRLVDRIWERAAGPPQHMHFWRGLVRQVERDVFLAQLLAVAERDERHVLALAMAWNARLRPVWGDKTPPHLYHLGQLMEWYPEARVVHMMRDPRAVYVSERERGWVGPARFGLPTPRGTRRLVDAGTGTDVAIRWRLAERLDRRYRREHPGRYLLCHFEQLLADPEAEVRRVCEHVGIAFETRMLERRVTHSSYMTRGTPGLRPEAIDHWRSQLSPAVGRYLAAVAGPAMARHGYRP